MADKEYNGQGDLVDWNPDYIRQCSQITLAKLTDEGRRKFGEIRVLPACTELDCYDNNLTKLPILSESLISLNCRNNKLTELPILPENLERLNCQYNNNLPYEITINNIKEHNNKIKLIKRKEIIKLICT